ncbi:MAG: ABC transporter substrate-binding protein [Phototrophicaceae bacterium]
MSVFLKRMFVASLLLILAISYTSVAQEELEEQSLLLTFIPNIQFAPAYVGLELGLYEAAGYEVDLQYLDEPQVADLVASNINQFGVISGEQVIVAVSQGRPLVYVYEWFQQFPIGIVYSSDVDVESIEDLADVRIGIPGPFGATYSGLIALLNSAGLDIADIEIDNIGFSAPEVFCVGGVDASVIYVNNEPLQIANRAQNGDCGDVTDISVLPIGEVLNLVSNGIITNQQTIDENPELVATFVDIWDQSLQLTINNPARAYLLSAPYIEGLTLGDDFQVALETLATEQEIFLTDNPSPEDIAESRLAQFATLSEMFDSATLLQFQVLLATIDLWDAEQLGFSDTESWVNMQETLISLGLLDDAADVETFFTNDFLPDGDE